MEEPVQPDAVQPGPDPDPAVAQPSKLIRLASMTRAMLDEVRHAPLDVGGRARLAAVHQRTLAELREALSQDLLDEFDEIMVPLGEDLVSEAEIRVAQAQLIGWLEGLFHGIRASIWSQQIAAQAQLEEMRKRALNPSAMPGQLDDDSGGLYL